MKALIVNRIGDFGLSLGIFTIFYVYGSIDYATVFTMCGYINEMCIINTSSNFYISIKDLICFFLFIGAIGKSAQIGLHT